MTTETQVIQNFIKISTGYASVGVSVVNGVIANHNHLSNLDTDDHTQYHTDERGDARYAAIAYVSDHVNDTDNPHSVTVVQLGLDQVDNTSDLDKPISTTTQNALDLKVSINSPAFTGTPTSPTPVSTDDSTRLATTAFVKDQGYVISSGVTNVSTEYPFTSTGGTTPTIGIDPTFNAILSGVNKYNSTTVDPTSTDDMSLNYSINSLWTNTTTDTSYICVDDTTDAAVWIKINGITNLTYDSSLRTINNSSGTDITLPLVVSNSTAGLMSGTDKANLDIAVLNTDTTTAEMSFVIDEDDLISDSATKVPTQQSVKAYVDGQDVYSTGEIDTLFGTIELGTNTITNSVVDTDLEITGNGTGVANIDGNAATVNNLTVETAVPVGAVFTDTTYTSSDFNHNDLNGVVANEHIDWTVTQTSNIHPDNYTGTVYNDSDVVKDSDFTIAGFMKTNGNGVYSVYPEQDAADVRFTPYGSVASTTVQGAIQELVDEGGGGGVTNLVDLTDTTIVTPLNGQALVYDSGTSRWINTTPVTGVTDHILLTNIGTNTHTQIDTHIADTAIHFSQSAVAITGGSVTGITDLAVLDGGTGASDAATARTNLGLGNVPNVDCTNASNITTGTIDLARLPQGALERQLDVADQTARYALTTVQVQNGDVVKQIDTSIMYRVVDDTQLDSSGGYSEFTAGIASQVNWSGVLDKPDPAITLTGDVTGSGTMTDLVSVSITTVVGNDSHSHTHTTLPTDILVDTDVGVSIQAYSAVLANTTASYTTTEASKLDGIEAGAEVNNISDVNATDLTDSGDSTLHYHSADRDRANHTGTQPSSSISDYATTLAGTANTTPFTPTASYHVATKKYVDDNAGGGGGGGVSLASSTIHFLTNR